MENQFDRYIFRFFLFWYVCGVILLTFDLVSPSLEWANVIFLLLSGILGVIYFIRNYSMRKGFSVVALIFTTTMMAEWTGVRYGFLFGHYSYNADFGPQLVGVPITIGFAWIMVIATTHAIAKVISQHVKGVKKKAVYLLCGPSAAVILDLILDPVAFVAKEYWIWDGNGVYYGIPFSNFVDWFLVAFALHLVLAFYLLQDDDNSTYWSQRMAILYGLMLSMFVILAISAKLWLAIAITAPLVYILFSAYVTAIRKDAGV
ncbi:carotenoid biosynthesis protein [Bacillus alkalicellulosilyticus]|uniref:carotenoid biosynthesis protein n=1 Tax=Alkalihalobacterium alkalicellulosilyticum TaxID=1912214 RepID=UPI0009963A9C|nr:carotenoid biosynthesis protein [Bacillus alkalicellulosilyticus]